MAAMGKVLRAARELARAEAAYRNSASGRHRKNGKQQGKQGERQ